MPTCLSDSIATFRWRPDQRVFEILKEAVKFPLNASATGSFSCTSNSQLLRWSGGVSLLSTDIHCHLLSTFSTLAFSRATIFVRIHARPGGHHERLQHENIGHQGWSGWPIKKSCKTRENDRTDRTPMVHIFESSIATQNIFSNHRGSVVASRLGTKVWKNWR